MKQIKLLLLAFLSFSLQNTLFSELHILGPQSHVVFMDSSSKVRLNNSVPNACSNFFLVKKSDDVVLANEYDYSSAGTVLCDLVVSNSNWITNYNDTVVTTSDAVNYYGPIINQNENNVADVEGRLDYIDTWSSTIDHGPGDIEVNTTTTSLIYDLWLSKHHKLSVDTATAGGNVILDGATHFMHFAQEQGEPAGLDPIFTVNGGNTCELQNVVLKDFSPHYIDLQSGSQILFGDGTTVEMTNNDTLNSNYTFSCNGKVRINCFGNELNLQNISSAFDILPSSTLLIQNALIVGLENTNLKCLAPDSTLTLSNCKLFLTSNYSFTEGFINIYHNVLLSGGNQLTYQSPQLFTIHSNSEFKVDHGANFRYDSGTSSLNASNDHLLMEDQTARLFLDGCTLQVSTTGLQLTKGTLLINHIVEFESDATNQSEAISFGDGISPTNDLFVEVLPGGTIEVLSGHLAYKNIN